MSREQYIDDLILDITRRKSSIGCLGRAGLLFFLESLGFRHQSGKSDNHKIFTHKKLSSVTNFKTFSIDCGHGMKKHVKPCYPHTVLNVLKTYKNELKEIYREL